MAKIVKGAIKYTLPNGNCILINKKKRNIRVSVDKSGRPIKRGGSVYIQVPRAYLCALLSYQLEIGRYVRIDDNLKLVYGKELDVKTIRKYRELIKQYGINVWDKDSNDVVRLRNNVLSVNERNPFDYNSPIIEPNTDYEIIDNYESSRNYDYFRDLGI